MGCSASKTTVLPHIVVVGGSYAAAKLVYLLGKEDICSVTMIDNKEAMIHELAAMRVCVEPESSPILFVSNSNFSKHFIQAKMTSLDRRKKQVVLGSGRKVKYDYLVIATGTLGAFPGQLPDVTSAQGTAMYRDFCFSLRKSHRVLIIGGNRDAIGLAGEVKTDYPDKQVIIHHVCKQLLFNDAPASVQSALQHILYRKDIEVYLNSKVIEQQSIKFNQHEKDQVVKTDSGEEFEVDLVVECPDRRKNSELFKSVLGGSIDGAGSIKVDSNLKVEGCDDIYAIGDVNNTSECTLESEIKQAEYLAAHLKAVITNAETTVYARDEPTILIPIGRYSGCGLRHGKDLDEDDVMELISTNLMTKQLWEGLGLTCPLSTFT